MGALPLRPETLYFLLSVFWRLASASRPKGESTLSGRECSRGERGGRCDDDESSPRTPESWFPYDPLFNAMARLGAVDDDTCAVMSCTTSGSLVAACRPPENELSAVWSRWLSACGRGRQLLSVSRCCKHWGGGDDDTHASDALQSVFHLLNLGSQRFVFACAALAAVGLLKDALVATRFAAL